MAEFVQALRNPLERAQARGMARLGRLLHGSSFYWAWLRRNPVTALATGLTDPWTGDAQTGALLLSGEASFDGESRWFDGGDWSPAGASAEWRAALHSFTWLRDLRAVGSDAAQAHARRLTFDWLARHADWDAELWSPALTAARIAAWGTHFSWIAGSSPELGLALCLHLRHLGTVAGQASGHRLVTAVKGLVFGSHLLALVPRERDRRRRQALLLLDQVLTRQIHADGGHAERSPRLQLQVLRDLVEMRACLTAAKAEIPVNLAQTIDRMAPILRFFRHADGGLALFNNSTQGDPERIDQVLARSEARGKPPLSAPHTGFHRLAIGKSLVIADAGAPAAIGGEAHAGTLSFELSVGKERLIVNCGAHRPATADWRRAERATAAHSTLTLADTNSSRLGPDGLVVVPPGNVTARREETDGNIWLDLSHDGYQSQFGAIHRRRLFLAASGDDLRGEDSIPGCAPGTLFAVRFHLHPGVLASLAQGGGGVLLKLPGGGGWRLRAAGGDLALAESIYMGRDGEMKRTQQIVVSGAATADTLVKWALQRETRK